MKEQVIWVWIEWIDKVSISSKYVCFLESRNFVGKQKPRVKDEMDQLSINRREFLGEYNISLKP